MRLCLVSLVLLGSICGFSKNATAAYLMIAPGTGYMSGSCSVSANDGTVTESGSGCLVYLPISVESGKTLSSVTVYYYDNSGSQTMTASVMRATLSSSGYTMLASTSDRTISPAVQFVTLYPSNVISSSYTYFVSVYLGFGTQLRGIRIYYY